MNALAAVIGGAPDDGRRAVDTMFTRMPQRATGRGVFARLHHPVANAGASGHAPAIAEHADAAIVGDILLSNRADVRSSLGLTHEADDAALALACYLRDGLGFAQALIGSFAFVILDRRERRVLAVRDALGIRPLHYRLDKGVVHIASDLSALKTPDDRPDEGFLAEVLTGDVVGREATAYARIRRLPAAHLMVIDSDANGDAGRVRLTRYWEPPFEKDCERDDDYTERLRATFDLAVRACCDGAPRVGLHLSGGLDSSSVLGSVMAQGVADPVVGANVFPWPEADERPWIDAAARRWGIAPHFVTPSTAPARHDVASIAAHHDLPDYPSGAPLFEPLHRVLREQGATVVLTGLGGDQWWTGESAHMADLLRAGRWSALASWQRAGTGMGELEWRWSTFLREGIVPLVPASLRRTVRRARPARLPAWIDQAFATRVNLLDRLRARPTTPSGVSESWKRRRWRIDSGEEALTLERFDRLSVAQGIEMRHPMYDRRLVELAMTMPDQTRIADGRSRVVLREAMRERLAPETVARTSKADFTRLFMSAASSSDLAHHRSLPLLSGLGWIDRATAASIVARASTDLEAGVTFWYLVGVEAWLRSVFGAE